MVVRQHRICDFEVADATSCNAPARSSASVSASGRSWRFDLCSEHLREFTQVLRRFGAVPQVNNDTDRTHVARSGERFSAREARAWLRKHGHRVSDAGRLSATQLAEYADNN